MTDEPVAGEPAAGRLAGMRGRLGGLLRRHWLMTGLLTVGLALRVVTMVAYRPALIYIDSVAAYLDAMPSMRLTGPDPIGYVIILLRPVLWVGNLVTITAVQHLLGLAMAVVIYALLVRKGAWRWLAAVATVPVLLDAYQVQIEHNVMADTLFQALVVAGFATLAWRDRPGWRGAAVAGLLLGLATTVRVVGQPAVVPAVLYAVLVARGWRWRLALPAVVAVAFAVPVVGYSTYSYAVTGRFALSPAGGEALYGRVATFADCTRLELPAYEQVLCPSAPVDQRPGVEYWAHDPASPRFHFDAPTGLTDSDVLTDFSMRVLRHQPFDFVSAVARDAAHSLSWNRDDVNPLAPVERWRFQTMFPTFPDLITIESVTKLGEKYGGGPPVIEVPLARFLRGYQLNAGYTPGPLLALSLLVSLVALAGTGRARRSGARLPGLLFAGGAVVVLLFADAFEFTWRYQLPGLVLLPVAGALGVTALVSRGPGRGGLPAHGDSVDEDTAGSFPQPADREAIAAFREQYGDLRLPAIAVVIAAYNEAAGIGPVLDAIPATHGDLAIATLVVVDGSTDATADVARAHGAYTCVMPVNRGQGAALRLGYHLARTHGAELIVTTDADGQYDIGELPVLLEPLLSGEADFVTGSRRLGTDESRDQVRRTGVRVFAWLVSVLTGQRVTDTSFGLRAMRAEVTGAVTLTQPQYQSSELLVGALSRGFRVVERPMTMRRRGSGRSKKGNNLVYGLRYARVVVTTWARERRRERLRSRPPARPASGPGRTPRDPAART